MKRQKKTKLYTVLRVVFFFGAFVLSIYSASAQPATGRQAKEIALTGRRRQIGGFILVAWESGAD